MHVIGGRCAALRPVVDDEVAWKRRRKIQHGAEFSGNALYSVLAVNDRAVAIDDWKWIAIDRVVGAEWDSSFLRIQISGAEKARALRNRLAVNSSRGAAGAMRNVPDKNIEPIDPYPPCARLRQPFDAPRQTWPVLHLLLKELIDFMNHNVSLALAPGVWTFGFDSREAAIETKCPNSRAAA